MYSFDPVIGAFADAARRLERSHTHIDTWHWQHLWAWHVVAVVDLHAAVTGREPTFPAWYTPFGAAGEAAVDRQNAVIDALHPQWTTADAYGAWHRAALECIEGAELLTPSQRADTTAYPWLAGLSIDDVVRWQTEHINEHFPVDGAQLSFDTEIYRLRMQYQRWCDVAASADADARTHTHLWAWQTISIARIIAGRDGTLPQYPAWPTANPDNHDQVDINAWIERTHGGVDAQAAIERWDVGFRQLLSMLVMIPAEWYSDPARCPWLDGYVLLDVVKGSTEHHAEHAE